MSNTVRNNTLLKNITQTFAPYGAGQYRKSLWNNLYSLRNVRSLVHSYDEYVINF